MATDESGSEQFVDSLSGACDAVYDLCCDICSEDNKNNEAVGYCVECRDYLCGDCFKSHTKTRLTRNHVLHDSAKMPRTKPPSPPPVAPSKSGDDTETCDKHPGRAVEYYCRDDGTLGCSVCMTMSHRLCKKVDHIPDLIDHLLDSTEYLQFNIALDKLKIKSLHIQKVSTTNEARAKTYFTDAMTSVQALRNETNKVYDKLETDIRAQTEKIKSNDIQNVKDKSTTASSVLSAVDKVSLDLHNLKTNQKLGQFFIEMIRFSKDTDALDEFLDLDLAEADNCVTPYIFKPGKAILQIHSDPTTIGSISMKTSASAANSRENKPRNHDTGSTLSHARDINIKTNDDANNCRITGTTLVAGDKLVLSDFANKKVKLLNLKQAKIVAEVSMESECWDLANINDTKVAVTLPASREIVFVKIGHQLSFDSAISVDGECRAILYSNNRLIVAFKDPKKIEIISLDGRVIRHISGKTLFQYPSHMIHSSNSSSFPSSVFVADYNGECVKHIALDGSVEAVYRDDALSSPRGIVLDKNARLLVCGATSDNIHLLNPDLTKVNVFLGDLQYPQSISLCRSTGRLYVGMQSNIIKVYILS